MMSKPAAGVSRIKSIAVKDFDPRHRTELLRLLPCDGFDAIALQGPVEFSNLKAITRKHYIYTAETIYRVVSDRMPERLAGSFADLLVDDVISKCIEGKFTRDQARSRYKLCKTVNALLLRCHAINGNGSYSKPLWLARYITEFARSINPKPKQSKLTIPQLIRITEREMALAREDINTDKRIQKRPSSSAHYRYRDALMLRMLCDTPFRIGAFLTLELGSSFIAPRTQDVGYIAQIPEHNDKIGRFLVGKYHSDLNDAITYYIERVLPGFNTINKSNKLWRSRNQSDLQYSDAYKNLLNRVLKNTGEKFHPHLIRNIYGTYLAQIGSDRASIAAGLQQSHLETGRQIYIPEMPVAARAHVGKLLARKAVVIQAQQQK